MNEEIEAIKGLLKADPVGAVRWSVVDGVGTIAGFKTGAESYRFMIARANEAGGVGLYEVPQ